jgi:hypothetical protein
LKEPMAKFTRSSLTAAIMRYLEWNNIIGNYFFNKDNAGKDIFLYMTRNEVLDLGKPYFTNEDPNQIWKDFISAIEKGLPGSNGNIVERAKDAFARRSSLRIDSVDINFPPYIAYLTFFVMPLIEIVEGDFNTNNYFSRLNLFLEKNSIKQKITSLHFRDNQINHLWFELSNWAVGKNKSDLGSFIVKPFSNPNWVYVGKMFSQCVLPPALIKKFPEFFLDSGMVPNSFYSKADLKKRLLQFGFAYFNSTVLDLVRKSETNELGESIIENTKKEYGKWTGESHRIVLNGAKEITKRNYTICQLLLQLKINETEETIHFSFRMYSSNDYPEDLKFGNLDIIYESRGYSKTLELPEKYSSVDSFDLKDSFNYWIAKFPQKDVRLFVSAGNFQLSTGYWIETETLSRTDWMFLLCRNDKKQSILDWGKHFRQGNFILEDLEGIPENYSLFKFLNPTKSNEEISLLTLFTEKEIQLVGGLKLNFRVFLSDFLPEIEIINSDGHEKVILHYKNIEEQVILKKKSATGNRWLLPEDIILNTDFYIKIEGDTVSGYDIAYTICDDIDSTYKLDERQLPKRDSFGRKNQADASPYSLGSNVIGIEWKRQEIYKQYFTGIKEEFNSKISSAVYEHHEGNMLLSFLTLKGVSNTEDFYKAFEFLYSKRFGERHQGNINYSKLKRSSINFYDYLGFLDYDYEEKRIVVNPPQFVFIPAEKGRKVLLIGGRDSELINSIIDLATKHRLQVQIKDQLESNQNLLLPDAITISAYGKRTENFGEGNIKALAQELQIKFVRSEIIQFGLQSFSANIDEYQNEVIANNQTDEDDYNWARRIFNVESLEFERNEAFSFDKTFCLIEYTLNEYTFYNKLWKGGKCYAVDKNWGRFLALRHFNKQVILYNNDEQKVAIPLQLPLPRLLAESIMLLSGLAPIYTKINSRPYRVYENVPSPFIKNLFDKLKQQPLLINFK